MTSGRWSRYARRHLQAGGIRIAYEAWSSHVPTLSYLLQFRPPPARLLSIGCGLGLVDLLLAGHGYEVTSIDDDEEVLESARALAQRFGAGLRFEAADAFHLDRYHDGFDIAFSAGLVEHWNGRRTVELLAEHARCAPLVQVEVPTRHTFHAVSVREVAEDMHVFTPREFAARVREAGLQVEKLYPTGGVPTRTRQVLESLLPPFLFRRLQRLAGYSMGIGCIARRLPG